VSIGLDGEGRQLAYASRYDDHDEAEIWTFDGQSTKLLGSFTDVWGWPEPIPIAHPNPSHEHAAFMQGWREVTLLWPEFDESLSVPFSPTIADPSCLITDWTVATRTTDGRIWLAWALYGRPNCDVPAVEAPTLRLVEVDPEPKHAREVMRLQLDPTHLEFSNDFVSDLNVSLAITSFADQLALVIADGAEDQRLHVIHVDLGSN
jgi:hypothetical protein